MLYSLLGSEKTNRVYTHTYGSTCKATDPPNMWPHNTTTDHMFAFYTRAHTAILKLLSNPFFVGLFFLRFAYNLYVQQPFESVYSLCCIMLVVMVTTYVGEQLMKIPHATHTYQTFWSDHARIQAYWQKHLTPVRWFFRGAYLSFGGLALYSMHGLFGSYEFDAMGMTLPMANQHVDSVFCDIGFGLGGCICTALADLAVHTTVVYMVPSVELPTVHTCRYCVDACGKITLICFGGAYLSHDVPFLQHTIPADTARWVMGKPLLESPVGHFIYANIRHLVENGEMDITLLTDPKTGRLSDDLMCVHMKTTYKQLIIDRCSPGFAAKYAAPERVLVKAFYAVSDDVVQWTKKAVKSTLSRFSQK